MAAVDYQNKVMLISILILKVMDSALKSKRFSSQSNLQAFKKYISDMAFFCWLPEYCHFLCYFWMSLFYLIYLPCQTCISIPLDP